MMRKMVNSHNIIKNYARIKKYNLPSRIIQKLFKLPDLHINQRYSAFAVFLRTQSYHPIINLNTSKNNPQKGAYRQNK